MKPVKLFVILEDADVQRVERLLESNFGPIDQRTSLIPNDWKFLSFDRLIDLEEYPNCVSRLETIAAGSRAGFLQNHRVVVENEELIYFKNGKIESSAKPDSELTSPAALQFFAELRIQFRQQLRTMCLLRTPR